MTDETEKPDEREETQEDAGPVGGGRLAEARRAQQIPVLEIAKELHLDEYKVRAIERNEFEVLGAPVFAKGHLRKYAQLVDVPEEDVMADYYQLNRSAGAPPVVTPRRRPRQEISPGPWIAAIVILLAVAAAYWWFVERAPVQTGIDVGQVAPLPVDEAVLDEPASDAVDEASEPDVALPADDEASEPDVALPADDEPADEPEPVIEETAAEPQPVSTPDPGQMRLTITYSGDCWTEISDGNGRRLFFDLGTSGRTVNLSGEAPFNILFGDAENVSLELNGSPYTIPAANRRGKTARLTLAGS